MKSMLDLVAMNPFKDDTIPNFKDWKTLKAQEAKDVSFSYSFIFL